MSRTPRLVPEKEKQVRAMQMSEALAKRIRNDSTATWLVCLRVFHVETRKRHLVSPLANRENRTSPLSSKDLSGAAGMSSGLGPCPGQLSLAVLPPFDLSRQLEASCKITSLLEGATPSAHPSHPPLIQPSFL